MRFLRFFWLWCLSYSLPANLIARHVCSSYFSIQMRKVTRSALTTRNAVINDFRIWNFFLKFLKILKRSHWTPTLKDERLEVSKNIWILGRRWGLNLTARLNWLCYSPSEQCSYPPPTSTALAVSPIMSAKRSHSASAPEVQVQCHNSRVWLLC